MVFCCNSRRNHAYWQSKTSEDLWSLWEEEEWRFKWSQKTWQREELCSQAQDILYRSKHPKRQWNRCFQYRIAHTYAQRTKWGAWRQSPMNSTHRRLVREFRRLAPELPLTCVWRMFRGAQRLFLAGQGVIMWLFGVKSPIF